MRQQLVTRLAVLAVLAFSLVWARADVNDIRLNEILANNTQIPNANGTFSDWVELYNAGAVTVDLAGCSLSDSNTFPQRYVFPPGSIIGPNSYLKLTFDSGRTNFANNVPFGIKASGGYLYFYSPTDQFAPVSQIEFGIQTADFSIGCVPDGTANWVLTVPTLGGPNVAAELGSPLDLKINEWMANPSSGDDYIELFNTTNKPVAIGGAFLSDTFTPPGGLTKFRIADLSFVGTGVIGGYLIFQCDSATNKYPADHTNFGLRDEGEIVAFSDVTGSLIEYHSYTDQRQHKGASLGRLPDGSPNIVQFPKINDFNTASPGAPNFLILTNLYINEILTHTDPPLEDAVEIVNRVSTNVNISGWWLSNSRLNPKRYLIPDGPALPPAGFRVIYEGVNTLEGFNSPNAAQPFTFNSARGDQVVLSQTDGSGNLTGYILYEEFEAAANGVTFGYYKTSYSNDYKFVAMAEVRFGVVDPISVGEFRTGLGATNSYPKIGPVVINEIMYAPARTVFFTNGVPTNDENPDEEFIELRNITSDTIPLYDPLYPTNHWKLQKAVDFTFPLANLGPNQFCLIVGFDPQTNASALASFRSLYGVSNDIPIFGPWTGRLANSADAVELYKPDHVQLAPHPDAGFVPYVRVDKVNYLAGSSPWPTAVQNGSSLQRKNSLLFGNDYINWAGSPSLATAGRATPSTLQDTDGDGMSDSWETTNGFLPNDSTDADDDPDGDGVTNLAEYVGGTNPHDSNSILKMLDITPSTGTNVPAIVRFLAYSNATYSVEYRNSTLPSANWQKLDDVPSAEMNRIVEVYDTNAFKKADRYYRVVAPATN